MNGWIWAGIIFVVLVVAWLSIRNRRQNSGGETSESEGGFWNAVKDACCLRRK
jgi:hypothetical protein